MFLIGLAGFGTTSVLCGLAPNMELLIVFRLLQGAAGALLVPGSLAILTATFHGEEQGRAFGVWAAASGAATILGPFVGGLLVDTLSWRLAFLINVPARAHRRLGRAAPRRREPRRGGHRPLRLAGRAGGALAVGGLSFGPIYGGSGDWQDPLAFVSLGVGVAGHGRLPVPDAAPPDPLVPLSLFRSRNFTVTNISTFLIYGALYVYVLLPGALPAGHARLHGRRRRAWWACPARSSWSSSRPASGRWPRATGRACSWPSGR